MRRFFGKEKAVAILGDNIFEKVNVPKEAFKDEYAYIFLKKVSHPERFGVAVFDDNSNLIEIEEKPKVPNQILLLPDYTYILTVCSIL